MLDKPELLIGTLARQLDNIVPDASMTHFPPAQFDSALGRIGRNVSRVEAWAEKGFDPINSGQYAIFLYYLANELWKTKTNERLAQRLFLLNKAINGIDLFPSIQMPEYFLIGHTVGAVFGQATYGDFCVFHQGCTVGRIQDKRPRLAQGVVLYPGAAVIGDCEVRANTVLSAGVRLINRDTPGDCLVFDGPGGNPVFKAITETFAARYYLGL